MAATRAPTISIGQNGMWTPDEGRRAVGVRVRADREERRIAEVEQAGQADDDVQPEGQQDEDACVREAVHPDDLRLEHAERRDAARCTGSRMATIAIASDDRDRAVAAAKCSADRGGAGAAGAAARRGRSCPLSDLLAEDAARPEDEHEDQDDEHDAPGPARWPTGRDHLDEGDDEAAERRPGRCCRCRPGPPP